MHSRDNKQGHAAQRGLSAVHGAVVVAVKRDAASALAVERARIFARVLRRRLVVVHVTPRGRADAEGVRRWVARSSHVVLPRADVVAIDGDRRVRLVEISRRAALLVLGGHDRDGRTSAGTLVPSVVRAAAGPVLVAGPPGEGLVLAATRGDDAAARLTAHAAEVAAAMGLPLVAAAALPQELASAAAWLEALAAAKTRRRLQRIPGVASVVVLRGARPRDSIAALARARGADLVVVARAPRASAELGPSADAAAAVAKAAPGSVLVLPE